MKRGYISFDNERKALLFEAEDFYMRTGIAQTITGIDKLYKDKDGDYKIIYKGFGDVYLELDTILEKIGLTWDFSQYDLELKEV